MSKNEINVMSGASGRPGLDFVAAAFEKETGHAVRIIYALGAGGKKRLANGDFDVVVATSNVIGRSYGPAGLVEDGGINIGRAGIGVTARAGTAIPDIASVQALKRAVLEAKSILLTTETSGLYIESMLKQMDIYEAANAKAIRFGDPATLVDRLLSGGGNEIAFMPTNAIRSYQEQGLVLVGPLPDEVQFYREFIAVPTTNSTKKEIAWEFVRYCGGAGKPLLAAHGLS